MELEDGEIGILLGKNGAGKTTLFKNILGINNPAGGAILFDGEDLLKMSKKDRARRIAYVPQHIHFGSLSVYDSILSGRVSCFGFRSGKEDTDVVEQILSEMQLEDLACRNAEELSGVRSKKWPLPGPLLRIPKC
jgi:iron complex transport system ATP-binding protein